MEAIRAFIGGSSRAVPTMNAEQRRVWYEQQTLADQLARLRRVDAQIPFDRRHQFVPVHPHRRQGDGA